jgi:hypothetical protein
MVCCFHHAAGRIKTKGLNRPRMRIRQWVKLTGQVSVAASEKMMASEDKNVETGPAPKSEAAPKKKSIPGAEESKVEGGEVAPAVPSGYSRGEGQKPVSKAYRDNWNEIFAKKKKR